MFNHCFDKEMNIMIIPHHFKKQSQKFCNLLTYSNQCRICAVCCTTMQYATLEENVEHSNTVAQKTYLQPGILLKGTKASLARLYHPAMVVEV